MKTKTELDHRFDYPDHAETTKSVQQLLVVSALMGFATILIITVVLFFCDEIDLFFERVLQSMML